MAKRTISWDDDTPSGFGDEPDEEKKAPAIPRLPVRTDVNFSALAKARTKVQAAVNLKVEGLTYDQISEVLELKNAKEARQLVLGGLARMHPPEDAETLRQTAAMRAEALFRQSFAMASADYLIDDNTGERIPNAERRQWHEQAGKDLALHATITGAKAPTKVEVSATAQELNEMVAVIMESNGAGNELEASVFEVEEIPVVPEGEEL